jgi:hypothetical protein
MPPDELGFSGKAELLRDVVHGLPSRVRVLALVGEVQVGKVGVAFVLLLAFSRVG